MPSIKGVLFSINSLDVCIESTFAVDIYWQLMTFCVTSSFLPTGITEPADIQKRGILLFLPWA